MILSKGSLGLLNFRLLLLILTTIHHFLSSQSVDLLFAELSLDFTLFSPLVSMRFVDFSLTRRADCCDGGLRLVLNLVAIGPIIHVVEHLVLAHLILLTSGNLTLQDLLELIDVVREHIRHLWHSKGRDIGPSTHGFHRELLEVKDVVELFLDLVKLYSVFLDLPLLLLLGLLNLSLRALYEHIKEVRVNVEILLGNLNDLLYFLVLLHNLDEALTEAPNLGPDASLFLLSNLQLAVFLGAQLGLLDRVNRLIRDISRASGQINSLLEVAAVETIDVRVDI